ncbi:hypothetical protein [Nocardia nepalensis]|uniref:hypothetical protein n=1 Tax=Nocardia nepalensis TaxID=3375448 RepID=UPI003B66B932
MTAHRAAQRTNELSCSGAAWVDLVSLMPSLLANGIDPDPILATHPATVDANPAAITAFVCALSGYWARNSRLPAPARSPYLRVHQTENARISREWLTRRITTPGR